MKEKTSKYKIYINILNKLILGVLLFGVSCELNDIVAPSDISTFIKYYGTSLNQEGYSVIENEDGSMVLIGLDIASGDKGNVYVVKVDANGNEMFSNVLGTQNESNPLIARNVDNTGYIVVYETEESATKSKIEIIHLSEDLQSTGQKVVLEDTLENGFTYSPKHILVTSDQGYLISGTTTNRSNGISLIPSPNDINNGDQSFFLKLDKLGNKTWQVLSGSIGYDEGLKSFEIVGSEAENDKYLVILNTNDVGICIGYISKANPTSLVRGGNLSSDKSFEATDAVINQINTFATKVEFKILYANEATGSNAEIGVINVNYDLLSSTYDNISEELIPIDGENVGYSVTKFDNEGEKFFYITGATRGNSYGDLDYHLIKLDDSHNLIWEKHFGSTDIDQARDIIISKDGGIVLFGFMQLDKIKMMGLIKLDQDGDFKN